MKALIVAVLLSTTVASAAPSPLQTWTNNSSSVQAVLWDALYAAYENDQNSPYQPMGFIKKAPGTLLVRDERAALQCESRQRGMAAVQSYRCTVEGDLSRTTSSSSSPQAVLYNALALLAEQQKSAPAYLRTVVRRRGTLTVKDEHTTVVCRSGQAGMLTVQQYSCEIK
ncbi:MAG TPA: hypothetical protein VFV50_14750 [Bdellovibrionales bacterium]|nr:hypothetical protein [Bdellovibrionales bacterium]